MAYLISKNYECNGLKQITNNKIMVFIQPMILTVQIESDLHPTTNNAFYSAFLPANNSAQVKPTSKCYFELK